MSIFARLRVKDDLNNLVIKLENMKLEENVLTFTMRFNSMYYKKKYTFRLVFPDDYPFVGPKLYCQTPTFHPNIYEGVVCLKILRDGWMPSYNINSAVLSLIEIFENVSEEDPFNEEAANMLQFDPVKFMEKIKECEKKQEM
ncbi:UBC12 [Enterospora canceri]|uniref:UBC12 n=1 Tax=Enterospora canceri TaxID=1081671 RepID=A0A1Y1S5V3_9MICR|nr:UBC12 [Enterospora canceri]